MKTAREFMTVRPDWCTPDDDLTRVGRIMKEDDCGIVPIVKDSASDELIGVVTDRDIALYVTAQDRKPSQIRVRECMSTNLVTAGPDYTEDILLQQMAEHRIRRLMIVEGKNKLVGVVAQADLARDPGGPKDRTRIVEAIKEISEPAISARSR